MIKMFLMPKVGHFFASFYSNHDIKSVSLLFKSCWQG